MKKIFFFIIFLSIYGCNKPKTVLICGDHVCINKAEAEQYFEQNLSLEVKLVNKNKNKKDDLIELNMKSNSVEEKKISISKKKNTTKKLKILSKDEILKKKKELKARKKISNKKLVNNENIKLKKNTINQKSKKKISNNEKSIISQEQNYFNICSILEKCNIDEISKYLVEQGKNKRFPKITYREINE